jgi:L-threonylcarbamoyladenylate synthase
VTVGVRTETIAPDAAGITRAADCLRAGGLVGMPTETVYGLAGDAASSRATASVFAAKVRPTFNPLIAHVSDTDAAMREGAFDRSAETLAHAFWPGPLTIVAPLAQGGAVCELARAGLASVALRVPSHPVARALLAAFGGPIVAPSANRSGHVSATSAAHVRADLGGAVALILDAGPSSIGVESTIVACLGEPTLLRQGGVTLEAIEAVLGQSIALAENSAEAPLAPGQLRSHYAPRATLRLNAIEARPGEAALDFAGALGPTPVRRDLSPRGDLIEAASNLFAYLRELDASGAHAIAVAPIPSHGVGAAINDRLARAAAPRDG